MDRQIFWPSLLITWCSLLKQAAMGSSARDPARATRALLPGRGNGNWSRSVAWRRAVLSPGEPLTPSPPHRESSQASQQVDSPLPIRLWSWGNPARCCPTRLPHEVVSSRRVPRIVIHGPTDVSRAGPRSKEAKVEIRRRGKGSVESRFLSRQARRHSIHVSLGGLGLMSHRKGPHP